MAKIIINENDNSILDILKQVLEQEQYSVIPLLFGQTPQLLKLIKIHLPSLVLLDVKHNGEQAIKQLSTIKKLYPQLPIVAISCNSNIATTALLKGFDGYIEEPFDIDEVVTIIIQILAKVAANKMRQPISV